MNESQNIIETMDHLLNYQDSTDLESLPMSMWQTTFHKKGAYTPRAQQLLDNLKYNADNKNEEKLANQLLNYRSIIIEKSNNYFRLFSDLDNILLEHNIPFPKFDIKNISQGLIHDDSYYSRAEMLNAYNLLKDDNYRTHLKTQRTVRAFSVLDYKAIIQEANAIRNQIKKYYPEVRLLYDDVGIIGTSIDGYDDVGASSTPMTLTNEEMSIWEIELYLKEGSVKFRCRDSWAQNWGGDSFPKGSAYIDGRDITISDSGNYRVTLDLTTNTYEFIKIEE